MTPKTILWRGAVAALMTAMLTLSANAQTAGDRDPTQAYAQQGGECKPMLNAAGKAKFRPFTQAREIRGEGAAMADAIANWQRDVSAKYGSQWMMWDRADDKNSNCSLSSATVESSRITRLEQRKYVKRAAAAVILHPRRAGAGISPNRTAHA